MNNEKLERVSAFLDGEVSREEADAIGEDFGRQDAQLQRRAAMYNLIGAAMRAEANQTLEVSKPAAVAKSASGNIVPLQRPASDAQNPARESSNAYPASRPAARRRQRPTWVQPVAGLALAASVAAVTVMVGGYNQQQPAASAVVADVEAEAVNPSPVTTVNDNNLEGRDSLIMANHGGNHAAATGASSAATAQAVRSAPVGLVPFVRMVDTSSRWQAVSREELYYLQQPLGQQSAVSE